MSSAPPTLYTVQVEHRFPLLSSNSFPESLQGSPKVFFHGLPEFLPHLCFCFSHCLSHFSLGGRVALPVVPSALSLYIYVPQVNPASSPATSSNLPPVGHQLKAQHLYSHVCLEDIAAEVNTWSLNWSSTCGLGCPGSTCTPVKCGFICPFLPLTLPASTCVCCLLYPEGMLTCEKLLLCVYMKGLLCNLHRQSQEALWALAAEG